MLESDALFWFVHWFTLSIKKMWIRGKKNSIEGECDFHLCHSTQSNFWEMAGSAFFLDRLFLVLICLRHHFLVTGSWSIVQIEDCRGCPHQTFFRQKAKHKEDRKDQKRICERARHTTLGKKILTGISVHILNKESLKISFIKDSSNCGGTDIQYCLFIQPFV